MLLYIIHMDFETITDVSGSSGDPVKIGWCERNGERFKCIEKVYTHEKTYKEVLNILKKFKNELKDLGPDVIWNNDKEKIVYLEYIHSKTVSDFVKNIDIDSEKGRDDYTNLMKEVVQLSKTMNERDICHGQLHAGNVLVRDDMTLRIVDIDTLERKSNVDICYDEEMLIENIKDLLIDRYDFVGTANSELSSWKDLLAEKVDHDVEEVTNRLHEMTPHELKDNFVYVKPRYDIWLRLRPGL